MIERSLPNARGSAAALDVHREDTAEAVGCSRLLGGALHAPIRLRSPHLPPKLID